MTTFSFKQLPQFVRYLMVGSFNTLFGYGLFALLNWWLSRYSEYGYLLAAVLGNLIAITVAFLGYKWFVFRTRGQYLREWVRCVGVYGTMMLVGLAGLATLVPVFRHHMARPQLAPYLAAAVMTGVGVVLSFLGHKNFSFRHALARKDMKPDSETPIS
ncbi:MAG: GtrA family protein [Terracidiphilus sp.]